MRKSIRTCTIRTEPIVTLPCTVKLNILLRCKSMIPSNNGHGYFLMLLYTSFSGKGILQTNILAYWRRKHRNPNRVWESSHDPCNDCLRDNVDCHRRLKNSPATNSNSQQRECSGLHPDLNIVPWGSCCNVPHQRWLVPFPPNS